MLRRRLGTLARAAFALGGLAFLAVAFWQTWDRSTEVVVPAWWRLAAAFALLTVAMSLAYRAWAQLLPVPVRARSLAAGFFIAQLGKYVPGAVWQAVGQVGYATRAQVSWGRAATAFVVFAFTQASAGALVGVGVVVLVPGLAWWVRLGAVAALGLVLLLDRRWMVWAVARYRRRRPGWAHGPAPGDEPAKDDGHEPPKDDGPEPPHDHGHEPPHDHGHEPPHDHGHEPVNDLVPAQAAILRSCAWSVGVMLAMGAAFVVLVGGLAPTAPASAVVSGHALAWTAGFLAVPVPSGLGVREAVLIAVLGTSTGAAPLIAASVYFRLAQMLAELVLIALTRDWRGGVGGRGGRARLRSQP